MNSASSRRTARIVAPTARRPGAWFTQSIVAASPSAWNRIAHTKPHSAVVGLADHTECHTNGATPREIV
jgi:hypothetical protein